jgi:protein-disulfide isomerase
LLAGVIVVAVVVAIVVAVIGHNSPKSPVQSLTAPPLATTTTATTTTATTNTTGTKTTTSTKTTTPPPTGPAAVNAIFKGIPQHGDTLGDPAAPVSLLVFEDPQCPFCDEWSLETLPTVVDEFVRTGKVKLVYRGIEIIGPQSIVGLRAIVGAGSQNKLWNLNEALYANQGKENGGWLTSQLVLALAKDLGLNTKTLIKDANSVAVTHVLEADLKQATAQKVKGTPTFVIQNPPALPKQLNESSLAPAGFVESLSAAIG